MLPRPKRKWLTYLGLQFLAMNVLVLMRHGVMQQYIGIMVPVVPHRVVSVQVTLRLEISGHMSV